MSKMAWEEHKEAFSLFVKMYNARKRKEKTAKSEGAQTTINQKAKKVVNTVNAAKTTINITTKTYKHSTEPAPGTIGTMPELINRIKDLQSKAVEARTKADPKKNNAYLVLWGQFKKQFSVPKNIGPLEWIKSQKVEKAEEFISFFMEKYNNTKEGRWKKNFYVKNIMTVKECHIFRGELLQNYGKTDADFKAYLNKMAGRDTTKGMNPTEYLNILRMYQEHLEHEE